MKARIWSATLAAIALGTVVAVLAQVPPSSSPTSQSAAGKITVTGCVQRAPQSPTGTTGSASAAETAKFVLAHAMISPSEPATSRTTPAASEYRLDTEDSKLIPHLGHKVEITGSVEPASRTAQPSASAASEPTLKVDAVKMVAQTCS